MGLFHLPEDIILMGVHVTTFPGGIKAAFDDLIHVSGSNRSYYGISWMNENDFVQYYAMVQTMIHEETKHPQ